MGGVGLVVVVLLGEAAVVGLLAAGDGFFIEEVGRLAAGVDEMFRQSEVGGVLGDAIELDQGELDFLVAVVAVLLVGGGAENLADVVRRSGS